MPFVSAIDPANRPQLDELERRMRRFYANPLYHAEWVRYANADWHAGAHDAQLALGARIPAGAVLLEVGCGDTAAAAELTQRVDDLRYYGVDITMPALRGRDLSLARASGVTLPFADAMFDVVCSMFTIEHAIYPQQFLHESWRVLRPGGELLIVAPDFLHNAMASERIGRSYGTGRDKLRRGALFDAMLTGFDARIRLPLKRAVRRFRLRGGRYQFPVLTNPRCLSQPGFMTDCDAVYPAAPEEIMNYMRAAHPAHDAELFYRDAHTFGLALRKR